MAPVGSASGSARGWRRAMSAEEPERRSSRPGLGPAVSPSSATIGGQLRILHEARLKRERGQPEARYAVRPKACVPDEVPATATAVCATRCETKNWKYPASSYIPAWRVGQIIWRKEPSL